MSTENNRVDEEYNFDCHLQRIGTGTLICSAARQNASNSTNGVDETICAECPAGRIFREVGCEAVSPKITIYRSLSGDHPDVDSLLCKTKRRKTTLEQCRDCEIVVAPTTRKMVSNARGLFEAHEFYKAYQSLEKTRHAMRDGDFESVITMSISFFESAMRTCHDRMGKPLPKRKQVTDLWKSTRELLELDSLDPLGASLQLMNAVSGIVSSIGGARNQLRDAHGKGERPPEVSMITAELVMNTAAALSTAVVRRFVQIRSDTS